MLRPPPPNIFGAGTPMRIRVEKREFEYYRARSENSHQISLQFEPVQSQWEFMRVDES